jgi:predicted transposase YbfD/YdcC
VNYPLPDVLLLVLLAVLAGAEAFTDIARFGERKIDLLRRFRPYANGTPSHDHLGDIFATFDAGAFQLCFVAWIAALTNTPAAIIAVDGKTSRRWYQQKGSKDAIHMVSAVAARQRIVLGQVKVNEKSNEIVAIPALLDMMAIEGAVVTIDAMGCQREIAIIMPYVNTAAMRKHLEEISRAVAPDAHGLIILDQAGRHTTRKLKVPKNLAMVPRRAIFAC